jgi:hypothetical protein
MSSPGIPVHVIGIEQVQITNYMNVATMIGLMHPTQLGKHPSVPHRWSHGVWDIVGDGYWVVSFFNPRARGRKVLLAPHLQK